jgi:AAA family ATP:ADP antiporter
MTMQSLLFRLTRARGEEMTASLWSFVYFFALLAGYYVLRPIRDEMAVQVGQARLQELFTAVFLTMLVVAPVFGALTARFPRKRLLPWIYGFLVANLGCFWLIFSTTGQQSVQVGATFFVWVSVVNLFAVSVFWSLMADLFDTAQAKRLYGFIAAGGTAGALAGPSLTALFVTVVGVRSMLLVSAAFLALCIVAITRLRAWAERTGATGSARDDAPLGGSMWAGIIDAVRSPYLLGICLFLFGYTLLSTLLYFQQTELVPAAIKDSAERTRLFALVDVAVNVLALLLQLFAFGAMMERLGTTFTLAALPAVAIAGFATLALSPTLATLVVFGVLRRAGEYAISKPARETLFNIPAAGAEVQGEERHRHAGSPHWGHGVELDLCRSEERRIFSDGNELDRRADLGDVVGASRCSSDARLRSGRPHHVPCPRREVSGVITKRSSSWSG